MILSLYYKNIKLFLKKTEKYDKGLKNLNIIFNSNQNHLRYFL